MSEENKEPTFGYIIRSIKEPENLDKYDNVYDIDNTSIYDIKPIVVELKPSNILRKIKLPVKS